MRKNNKKTILFADCESEVPIIEFTLSDGDVGHAVVDTGSETTLFDMNLIRTHREDFPITKTKNKINFVGLQKDTETVIIKSSPTIRVKDAKENTLLPIKIKDAMFIDMSNLTEHLKEQYNTDIIISAIIGSDMLTKLNAEINYKKKEISINYDFPRQ